MGYKTILETVVGSTLHGTNVSDGLEDLDIMAIVIEDNEHFVGFNTKDVWVERTKQDGVRSEAGDIDYVAYGLRKYLRLVLKGNPTALLPLFAPNDFIREVDFCGEQLRSMKDRIVSKLCFMPFFGYMTQQHKRLIGTRGQMNVTRPELVEKYGYDTKYAGHVVRLGIQGEELMSTGKINLPMLDYKRELIVDIRNGCFKFDEISEIITTHKNNLISASKKSVLPDAPDIKFIESWMIGAYKYHWGRQHE